MTTNIMIVGEELSETSSNLLKSMLQNAGIAFSECFITTPLLGEKEIKQVNPNIVILLGEEALRELTNKTSINKWRGAVLVIDGQKYLPTYHPANILRQYEHRPICEMDLKKAKFESNQKAFQIDEPEMTIMPTYGKVLEWFEQLKKDNPDRVSFDIETTYKTFIIRQIGFAYQVNNLTKAISISFTRSNVIHPPTRLFAGTMQNHTNTYEPSQEIHIIDTLDEFFRSDIKKVSQNGISFDEPILKEQFDLTINNHWMDTMHAHHLCYLELPKSLDFLTTLYTRYPNYWSEKITNDDRSNSIYNCWDCIVTLKASYEIEQELKTLQMDNLYFDWLHPLAKELSRMSQYGIRFDEKKQRLLKAKYDNEIEAIEGWIFQTYGKQINLNSSKQVKELLYEIENFPEQRNELGKVSTNAESIKKLSKRYPSEEILQKILRYREISKIATTYLTIKVDDDGCVRTSFNASGTDTGRISSSKTIRNTGTNFQNIPPIIRPLFIAREGRTFIEGDLSQAETLIVANLLAKLGYRTLLEKYQDPSFDIHCWAASAIFGVPEDQITKEQRQIGKLSNHSGNYGAGPRVLVSQSIKRGIIYNGQLGISYQVSKTILESTMANWKRLTVSAP